MPHVMRAPEPTWVDRAIAEALPKLARLREAAPGFPVSTRDGTWQFSAEGTWTAGFWPGRLWIGALLSGDAEYSEAARHWCTRLAPHLRNRSTHDLGMLFMPSYAAGWRLTGDAALREGALAAAELLASRFNAAGQFIRAIGPIESTEQDGYVIVDTLMNLPLLFWAARETGNGRFAEIAAAHARTSVARHLRPDGSTRQVFNFDAGTGAPIGPGVHQGLSADSCWSRGQAWAISGLAEVYRWTSDTTFLMAALSAARWWLAHCPEGSIPPWDFSAGPEAPRDASAGAIAACGLVELGRLTGSALYADCASGLLRTLWHECTTRDGTGDALLLHATGFLPAGRDSDVSLSYGDYFYLLGLLRLEPSGLYTNRLEIGVN